LFTSLLTVYLSPQFPQSIVQCCLYVEYVHLNSPVNLLHFGFLIKDFKSILPRVF